MALHSCKQGEVKILENLESRLRVRATLLSVGKQRLQESDNQVAKPQCERVTESQRQDVLYTRAFEGAVETINCEGKSIAPLLTWRLEGYCEAQQHKAKSHK